MDSQEPKAAEIIRAGDAALGIELGSTRVKALLIAPDTTPIATGCHDWENRLEDGVWTYDVADVWKGLAGCYASLANDVRSRYDLELTKVAAMGFSGMMHGYVALDQNDELLVPFRTWRNNITGQACAELTPLLDFAIPQRWSIAHLYQSILERQSHVANIARLTTLAGYVHLKLTGEHKMGVGEASGMFPIQQGPIQQGPISDATQDWDAARMERFDELIAPRRWLGWKLRDILPEVLTAGQPAGHLTAEGAKLLDPTGKLQPGIPFCPPEGDAGTGMVATNSVRPRSGNVSAGTSVFAMIVLEKSLSRIHEEIDIVTTPDGAPVAMAHSNNGSSDYDAWIALFGQVAAALAVGPESDLPPKQLYDRLLPLALEGDPDAGGLLSINYVSGEHMTGFTEGRPLFVRNQDSRFNLPNFIRSMLFSSLCAMRTGMNILTRDEGVVIDEIRGHGGFFKGGDTGQRMMAAALDVPVSIPATAGEGGAWGMAVLAAYLLEVQSSEPRTSLADFLDQRIAASIGEPVEPDPKDVEGFNAFFARHAKGLAIERAAVEALQSTNEGNA